MACGTSDRLGRLITCSTAYSQCGFGEADSDGDGQVTANELKECVSGKLPDFDRFKELMKELDEDKNGSLSEAEFAKRMTAVQNV